MSRAAVASRVPASMVGPRATFPLPGHSHQESRSTIEPGETLAEGFRYLILAAVEPESELVTSCWFASRYGI